MTLNGSSYFFSIAIMSSFHCATWLSVMLDDPTPLHVSIRPRLRHCEFVVLFVLVSVPWIASKRKRSVVAKLLDEVKVCTCHLINFVRIHSYFEVKRSLRRKRACQFLLRVFQRQDCILRLNLRFLWRPCFDAVNSRNARLPSCRQVSKCVWFQPTLATKRLDLWQVNIVRKYLCYDRTNANIGQLLQCQNLCLFVASRLRLPLGT